MRTIPALPLLTPEAERDLARAIEAGVLAGHLLASGERPVPASEAELRELVSRGEVAWQHFLLANVRLVWQLANLSAKRSGLPVDDLFQEAFLALAETLRRYDAERGRFSTFAIIRIRQHLNEATAVRLGESALPPRQARWLRQARGIAAALGQERGHDVSDAELAAALGPADAGARRLLGYRPPLLVDAANDALGVADPSPADPDAGIYAAQVRAALRRLPGDQAQVLSLRYGLATGAPITRAGVAERMGISVSTVYRLERGGLLELRRHAGLLRG